jgi:hypothetical protein
MHFFSSVDFCLCFWDRVLLSSLGWHGTQDPLVSAFWVLRLQALYDYAWLFFLMYEVAVFWIILVFLITRNCPFSEALTKGVWLVAVLCLSAFLPSTHHRSLDFHNPCHQADCAQGTTWHTLGRQAVFSNRSAQCPGHHVSEGQASLELFGASAQCPPLS